MRRFAPQRDDDRGASLALVMILVIGLSLVSASLLTYASTAIGSAKATAAANQSASDLGGALQAAINDVRNSDYFNNTALSQTCLNGGKKTYADPTDSANPLLVVSCDPDPGSGAAGGLVPVNNTNKPTLALLTLGTGGEPGLQKNGNSVLSIKGSVYSNSTIATANGTDCPVTPQPPALGSNCNEVYAVGAAVTAEGACSGRIITTGTPGLSCATGTHVSAGDDPGNTFPAAYAMPTTGMTPAALPSCSTDPVTFVPGYYDDAQGLSALFKNTGPCSGKTRWFQPGLYYFDFHNEEMPSTGTPIVPRDTNPGNKWVVDDPNGFVVAGTKKGWTTAATAVPDACVSPLTSTASAGVEFVFGGNSQFLMQRGQMELCGTWYTNKPPIALYGAKMLAGSAQQTPALVPSALSSTGADKYTTNAAATTGIATNADAGVGPTTTIGKNKTATLNVTGFSGLAGAIPPRALLESATLTVRHGESGANAGTTLTATLGVNKAGATTVTQPLTVSTNAAMTYTTQTFPLTASFVNDLYAFGATSAAPFTLAIAASADSANGQSVTSTIDYVKLDLTYRDIGVRAQSGCVTTVGGCAMFATNSTPGKELYIQGTAYLPRAQIDVTLNNISGQVFRSGLVARSALLGITASSTYAGPVLELPDNTLAPAPLTMFFTAWKCPSGFSGTPSVANGCVSRGRAKVTYSDGSFTPTSGQRGVNIDSWTVGR